MRQEQSECDGAIVVCGAGAAGLAAAISASRSGAEVLLVEESPRLGGTVANALLHTLGGFYDASGALLNDGLPTEIVERLLAADHRTRCRQMGRLWVLSACPAVYRETITRWIEAEESIQVLPNSQITSASRTNSLIDEVTIHSSGRIVSLRPSAVVDATGTAEVVRLIDPSLVMDDDPRSAGGWVFRLRGIAADALEAPKGIGIVRSLRKLAQCGELPPECAHAWLDIGTAPEECFVKLMVPLPADLRDSHVRQQIDARAIATQGAVVQFLKSQPGFSNAYVAESGTLGVRDGGRIRGRYILTGDDVRRGRSFTDAACRGAWPIEYWDAHRGVSLEYLPPGAHYDIPMRSLELGGLENVWVAGKCLSADREAHASARVAGTCWAMGAAAGQAAAKFALANCESPA